MSVMLIRHVTCDTRGGCPHGFDQEPMIGEPHETVADLLRQAGWRRIGGLYICNYCLEDRRASR